MSSRFEHLRISSFVLALVFASMGPIAGAADFRLDARILATQWKDDSGSSLQLETLKGRPMVLTMAYAACRKTCSNTLLVLKEIQKKFAAQRRVAEFVIVTYAPDSDTPKAWTQYRNSRDLNWPNWHFLSGTPQDTQRMANMLDLPFWSYDEHIMHDFRVVIFNADGKFSREIRWPDLGRLDAILAEL